MKMSTKKALIVGSGIGGMALSVLLANEGHEPTVLQKNAILGGRCTSYEKIHEGERYIVDMWTHTFPTAERAFNKIFKRAGLDHEIEFFHFSKDNPPQVWLGRSKKFELPSSISDLNKYRTLFPKMNFKNTEGKKSDKPGMMKLLGDLFTLSRRKLREADQLTFDEWLEQYRLPELVHEGLNSLCAFMFVNMAYDSDVKRGSAAGETIRCMRNWFKMITSGYPYGGSVGIVNGYRKALEELNGTVTTNAEVEQIIVENGSVKGVMVEGRLMETDLVISNAGLRETVLKLVGEECFPSDYVAHVEDLEVSEGADTWAFYSMKLGMDEKIIEPPIVFPLVWMDKSKELTSLRQLIDEYVRNDDLPPSAGCYITVPSNMDPSLCPPDKQLVNLGVIGPVQSTNFQAWYEFYLDLIEEIIPDFRDHILFMDIHRTGKPLQQWTGRFKGDAVGISQSVGQVGKNRPSPSTPIEGLYLVGADVGTTGIGTELSALSALDTWKAIRNE